MGRKKAEEEASGDSFVVLFTALSVLLLAFFILLNSLSSVDDKRSRKAIGSLTSVFSGIGASPLVPYGDSLITVGNEYGLVSQGTGKLTHDINKILQKEGLEDQVVLEKDKDDMVLVLADKVLFNSGQANIRPGMTEILDVIARTIIDLKQPVVIEGHTDNRPIRTALYPSNWELSTARAGVVARYLLENFQIPPDDVSCEGHAEFKPIADNATEEGRAKNRRVVIRFIGLGKRMEEAAVKADPKDQAKQKQEE